MKPIKRALGLTEAISIKRQTILAAIFFALFFFLAILQPALGGMMPFNAWVDGDGVLHVNLFGDADVKITCEDGYVKVDGMWPKDPDGNKVPCANIKGMVVNGGEGDNKIDLGDVGPENFPNVENVEINGGDGNDDIRGSGFGDNIDGGAGNDVLLGGAGDDRLFGGDGDDVVGGGDGDDALLGCDGNDLMDGGAGNDIILGGAGDDIIHGGGGNDIIKQEPGSPLLGINPFNRGGNDIIKQEPGSADTITDEAGNDILDFSPATAGITIDLDLQNVDQVVDAAGNTVRLEGQFENFVGSEFDDEVFVYPLAVPRSLDGGPHETGDTLNFDAQGVPVTDDGTTLTAEGFAPVTYISFETVNISNTTECLPSIEVNKMVFNETSGEWVDETTAKVNDTLRFRCVVHNNGTCCNLTDITVTDILSDSLEYRDNATVDGVAEEPTQVSENEYKWEFAGPLAPCEAITIEFDARVIECGEDTNTQNASAWCEEIGAWVYDEDTVWVNCTGVPDLVVEKSVTIEDCNFIVNYTVTNIGDAPAGESKTCKFVDGELMESQSCPALPPGGSNSGTFEPEPCPCGEILNVTVCADNNNEVDESNETNNCEVNFVLCPPGIPGIEVNKTVWNGTAWVKRIEANICDIVKFNSTIHNNGTCCDLFNITVMDTLSDSLEFVGVQGGTPDPDEVIKNPDGSTTLKWFIPGPLAPCNSLTFLIDAHVTKCGEDWNKQNATADTTCGESVYDEDYVYVTVLPKPDLVITEKWVCWPDNCTICYNVTNIGNGTAPACHNTALYVDGVAVAHDHVPVDLAPGESYTGCFNGYVWAYTPPSDDITVCADNNEALDELDEDNNCLTNIWMCGDVNCDGKVTMSDVRKVFNRYLDPNYPLDLPWAADVNCDGKVTMSDVRKVFNRYLDPGYDLNCCGEGEE